MQDWGVLKRERERERERAQERERAEVIKEGMVLKINTAPYLLPPTHFSPPLSSVASTRL